VQDAVFAPAVAAGLAAGVGLAVGVGAGDELALVGCALLGAGLGLVAACFDDPHPETTTVPAAPATAISANRTVPTVGWRGTR
jgi:hypothetical protein